MSRNFLFTVITLLALGLFGCRLFFPERELTDQLVVGKVTIPDTTKVLDDTTAQYIVSSSSDGSTITFDSAAPDVENIQIGDVLAIGVNELTPNGLLRTVTSISQNGGQITFQTQQATLEDAIQDGEFRVSMPLTPSDLESASALVKGLSIQQIEKAATGDGFNFIVNMNNVILYDVDGNELTTGDQIIANGKISFNLDFDFYVKIDSLQLKGLSFSTTVTDRVEIDITASTGIEFIAEKELARYIFTPITIFVGPVPIIITPILVLVVGFDGSITVGLTTGIVQEARLTSGLEFDGDTENWTPISDHKNDFFYTLPSPTLACSFKVYAGPRLGFYLYGVAGPDFTLEGYLKLDVTPLQNQLWVLYGGLQAKAGVTFGVLGKNIANYQITLVDLLTPLAQDDGSGNATPQLFSGSVSPTSGDISTSFTYSVDYYDADGDSPTVKYVNIDDTDYTMGLSSGLSANGTYSYSTQLSAETTHNYFFRFSDGHVEARLPAMGTYSGPVLTAIIELKNDDGTSEYSDRWGGACPYGGNLSDGIIGFRKFLTSPSYPFQILKVKINFAGMNSFNAGFYLHIKDKDGNELLPTPFLVSADEVNLGWWEKDISSYGIVINSGKIEVSIFESYLPANCPPNVDWSIKGWGIYEDTSSSGNSIMKGPSISFDPGREFMIRLIGEI